MISVLYRPAGLAVGLFILAATGGCAHFHNAEVRAQERAGVQHTEPPLAEAAPPPPVAPEAPTPAPNPTPSAPEPAPAVASAPEVATRAAAIPPLAATSPAAPTTPVAPAPSEPVPEPPAAVRPAPNPVPAPVTAPATTNAVIIFANTPSANCATCETLKISVAPSGQVLMERGSWASGHSNWHYKRSRANVGPDRAAAFAASLSADRPVGSQTVGAASCAASATGDESLSIEWIEADRDDRLTAKFGCAAGAVAERLRHAPDLLGLQLAFP